MPEATIAVRGEHYGISEFPSIDSGLAIWLRESPSVLAYPTLLAFHAFGMAFLVGTSSAIALRLLGIASDLPLVPLMKFFSVIQIAAGVSFVSGLLLLMLDAVRFLTMPAFYIKLLGILSALILIRVIRARVLSDQAGLGSGPLPMQAKVLGCGVLVSWIIAITAGRVTAYAPFIGWQSAAAVFIVACVLLVGRHVTLRFLAAKKSA